CHIAIPSLSLLRQFPHELHGPLNPRLYRAVVLDAFRGHQYPALHRSPGDVELADVGFQQRIVVSFRVEPDDERVLPHAQSKLPFSRKPIPPNIFFSSMPFFQASPWRMRSASASSKAIGNLQGSLVVKHRVFYLDGREGPNTQGKFR